jgi:hypothetical protein
MPNPFRGKLKKEIESLNIRFSKNKAKTDVNNNNTSKSKDRKEDLAVVNSTGKVDNNNSENLGDRSLTGKPDIDRSIIKLGNRGLTGKSDIDRSKLKLEHKSITEGHKDKNRAKTKEGERGTEGNKKIVEKNLKSVLDGEPVPEKKEVKAENLYKDYKTFIRKTDSLTNVYTKK